MGFTEIRYPVEKKFPLWWEQFFQLYQFSAQRKPRESGGGAANAFLLGNVMDIKWWCTEAAYVPRWGELKRGAGGTWKYWRWYGFIQRKVRRLRNTIQTFYGLKGLGAREMGQIIQSQGLLSRRFLASTWRGVLGRVAVPWNGLSQVGYLSHKINAQWNTADIFYTSLSTLSVSCI